MNNAIMDETDVQSDQFVVNAPVSTQKISDPNDVSKRRILNDYSNYQPMSLEPGREQIRLLHIVPADNDEDDIECMLFDVPPNWDQYHYVALSYCWGDLEKQRTIKLVHQYKILSEPKDNSQPSEEDTPATRIEIAANLETGEPFNVTESLFQALRSIRRETPRLTKGLPGPHLLLWIDAICINQGDQNERSSQVGIMGSIFSSASSIFVWLDESDETIGSLDLISNMVKAGERKWGPDFQLLAPEEYQVMDLLNQPLASEGEVLGPYDRVQMLQRLFRHPYFKRVWVLSESSVRPARTAIHAANHRISWSSIIFADCLTRVWAEMRPMYEPPGLPIIWTPLVRSQIETAAMKQLSSTESRRWASCDSLQMLYMNTFEQFEASDLRDKLFALLDLSKEAGGTKKVGTALAPDYNKPITQVFCDFTRWIIQDSQNLGILSIAAGGPRRLLPGNPLHTLPDGKIPAGTLDARFHPSWALWPASGGVWTAFSLFRAYPSNQKFDLAANYNVPILDLSDSPWSIPSHIRNRLLSLAGKPIGKVKSVFGARIMVGTSDTPGSFDYQVSNTSEPKSEGNQIAFRRLQLSHVFEANTLFQGSIPVLWGQISRPDIEEGPYLDDELSGIVGHMAQEWLGREGGRYRGNYEVMFRDFIETLLLCPHYRGKEKIPDGQSDEIPRGPWLDPDTATSIALMWADIDWEMELVPPRIGKILRENINARAIPADHTFGELFLPTGRSFFITEDERMGLCSPDVQPGDIVVGLYGSKFPSVLRPMADEADIEGESWSFAGDTDFRSQLFRFMGDCYLHERMTSAFFNDESACPGPPDIFNIC